MGTGNALRATETFTLIQLEEERQKLKKKELLKSMLTDSEFSIKGQCAINLMMTKLDIINTFLLMKYKRNFIQMKTWRLKSYDSVCKKMQKKGLDLNFDLALEKINDLIGVRAVCAYVDDIYKVADLIEKQQDIHILKIKDYVQQPKKSGYQSLHLILEIAIPFQKENQWIKLELQLRTAAMDYWANLDHQLRYKRGQKQAAVINEELQQCASVITQLDQKMLDIRKKIDKDLTSAPPVLPQYALQKTQGPDQKSQLLRLFLSVFTLINFYYTFYKFVYCTFRLPTAHTLLPASQIQAENSESSRKIHNMPVLHIQGRQRSFPEPSGYCISYRPRRTASSSATGDFTNR